MLLKRIHYISGLVMSVFIFLHLINHLAALGGITQHLAVMKTFRVLYRNSIFETLLLVATALQVFSGIKLALHLRKNITSWFDKLHIWSGLYLAFFLLIHVSVVLLGRSVLHLDTNIYFGVAGLNTFPYNLFFIPYYSLAVLSFFAHVAAIHQKKMKTKAFGLTPIHQSRGILYVGLLATLFILAGLTNKFQGVTIPKPYHVLIGR